MQPQIDQKNLVSHNNKFICIWLAMKPKYHISSQGTSFYLHAVRPQVNTTSLNGTLNKISLKNPTMGLVENNPD
jgi:hypothetical protein